MRFNESAKRVFKNCAPVFYEFLVGCRTVGKELKKRPVEYTFDKITDNVIAKYNPDLACRLVCKSNVRKLDKYFIKQGRMQTGVVIEMEAREAPVGFFSLMFQVLGAMDFCQRNGCNLIVNYNTGCYVDPEAGPNWWEYFFETSRFQFRPGSADKGVVQLSKSERDMFAIFGGTIEPARACQMVEKVGIKPWVLRKVGKYADEHFRGKNVVGIHYRGTDKVAGKFAEAGRISAQRIMEYLAATFGKDTCFFVATDEESFLKDMQSKFASRVLCYDSLRSHDNNPLHYGNPKNSGFRLGEDALTDCLLLSRCNEIVRTSSNLSHACRFFNPKLKVTDLSRMFTPKQIIFSAEMGRVRP